MALPSKLAGRLTLPLIAAPMFTVSSPELVIAACRAGVVGAFPTANCRTVEDLDAWLTSFRTSLADTDAPYCANLVIRRPDLAAHLDRLCAHGVELVITSVGSPAPVIGPLHAAGAAVFCDVSTVEHARKAIAAGVDGLVLLTAGAGGQTGSLNGLAFARAVRAFFDGPIVLAGGICDGAALWAATAVGCDLGYMGTRFIATHESAAAEPYKQMLIDSSADDVIVTDAFTGLPTSMLLPSLRAAGIDPRAMTRQESRESASRIFDRDPPEPTQRRWRDLWSAGHAVGSVDAVMSVRDLVDQTRRQFAAAAIASAQSDWLGGCAPSDARVGRD